MTDREIHEHYMVPMEIIREYDSMVQAGSSQHRQYGEADLRCMSRIMSLRSIGFSSEETHTYMRLCTDPCHANTTELCAMLEHKRRETLEDIHGMEETISRLDYLLRELRCAAPEAEK